MWEQGGEVSLAECKGGGGGRGRTASIISAINPIKEDLIELGGRFGYCIYILLIQKWEVVEGG